MTCSRTGGGVEANTDFTRAVAALGTSVRMPVMMYAKSCRSSELWGRFVGFLGYVSYVGYVGSKYGKWGSERSFFDSSPFIYYPKNYACRFLASSNNVQGRCYTRARNRSEHNKQLSRARAVRIVTYPAATLRLTVERAATSPLRALSHVTLPADMAASRVHAPP